MKTLRKLFLIITPFLLLSAIAIQIYSMINLIGSSPLVFVSAICWIFSILWMLLMAVIYGSLYRVKWALICEIIFFVLMVITALMVMKHFTDAGLVAMVSPILFAVVYLVHFILKKGKRFVDVSKLIFTFSSLLGYLVTLFGSDYNDEIFGSWFIILIILFTSVYVQVYKSKEKNAHPVIAETGDNIFHN